MLIKIEHKDGEAWIESEDVGAIVRRGGKLKIFARRQPGITWEMDTDEEVAKQFIREVNAAKESAAGMRTRYPITRHQLQEGLLA